MSITILGYEQILSTRLKKNIYYTNITCVKNIYIYINIQINLYIFMFIFLFFIKLTLLLMKSENL